MKRKQYDLYESLGHLVDITSRVMRTGLNRKFNQDGIDVTAEQWKILAHLWAQDGLNQQRISDYIGKNKASTTLLIDGLERRGLVVRIQDQKDRRRKRIYLTLKGKEIQKSLTGLAEKNLEEAQKGITSEHLNICKDVLRRVVTNMGI